MANGGGSRAGGFVRGVLMGLIVCAIIAVVLSLWAPLSERAPVAVEPAAPGAAGIEGTAPAMGTGTGPETGAATDETGAATGAETGAGGPPAADVTVTPAEPAPATGAGQDGGQATVPQATLPGSDAAGGAADTGSNFSDEPAAGTEGTAPTTGSGN